MKIRELDDMKLGLILKQVPLKAHLLDHKEIKSTVKDYIQPTSEAEKELQFVVDLFKLTTSEVIEKWYGGKENADDLNMQLK